MRNQATMTTVLLCIGLAFIKAGFFTYAFTEGIFPYVQSGELMISPPTIVSYISMSFVLLIAPLFSKYYGMLKDHLSVVIASTLIVTLGSLIGIFSERPFELDGFSAASAICVGGASSLMYIIWGEMMSEFSFDKIRTQISITLVITFVLYVIAFLVPRVLSTTLIILFPLVSGALMFFLLKRGYDTTSESPTVALVQDVVQLSPTWRKWLMLLGTPHFVLAATSTALWALANVVSENGASSFLLPSFGFGALFATLLLLIALDHEGHTQISALTRFAIPPLIFAAIIIFLGKNGWEAVIGFMLVCSTTVFADFLNWTLFCELAHENPQYRSKIISWGRFFIYFGMLCGCIIGRGVVGLMHDISAETVWIGVLCLTVICMTILTLYVNAVEEFRINIILRKLQKAAFHQAKLDNSLQPFFRKNFDLTPREFEVLVLLHEGYSVSQIQDRLFLSQNTVNTHTKRIYKKLGVHSKVELYNLVENNMRLAETSTS